MVPNTTGDGAGLLSLVAFAVGLIFACGVFYQRVGALRDRIRRIEDWHEREKRPNMELLDERIRNLGDQICELKDNIADFRSSVDIVFRNTQERRGVHHP